MNQMAIVRLNQTLRKEIKDNVEKMFGRRLTELRNSHQQHVTEVYEAVVPKNLQEILKQVPPSFLTIDKELRIKVNHYRFDFTLPIAKPMPMKSSWEGLSLSGGPTYDKLATIVAAIKAVERERDTLLASVKRILEASKSIQQLIQLWPTCLDFVPLATLNEYNSVEPPKTRKQRVKERLDEASLTEDEKVLLIKTRILDSDK